MNLAKQQSLFTQRIFSLGRAVQDQQSISAWSPSDNAEQAIAIYQNNLRANAQRALAISFLSVAQLLGAQLFGQLTDQYLQQSYKTAFDWGEWGSDFALWLKRNAGQFSELEANGDIFADLAQFDLYCHQIERSEDKVRDLSTLALLSEVDAYQLSLNFAPGFTLFESAYPIATIKQQLLDNSDTKTVELPDVNTYDASDNEDSLMTHYLVLWRPEYKAQYQAINEAQYQWLKIVTSSENLGLALDNLAEDSCLNDAFSFTDWLTGAIQHQQLFSINHL